MEALELANDWMSHTRDLGGCLALYTCRCVPPSQALLFLHDQPSDTGMMEYVSNSHEIRTIRNSYQRVSCFHLFSFLDKVAVVRQPDYTPSEQVSFSQNRTFLISLGSGREGLGLDGWVE